MDKGETKSQINMDSLYEAGMCFLKLGQVDNDYDREVFLEGINLQLDNIIVSGDGIGDPDRMSFMMFIMGFLLGHDIETAQVFLSNNISFSTTAELIKEAMQKEET